MRINAVQMWRYDAQLATTLQRAHFGLTNFATKFLSARLLFPDYGRRIFRRIEWLKAVDVRHTKSARANGSQFRQQQKKIVGSLYLESIARQSSVEIGVTIRFGETLLDDTFASVQCRQVDTCLGTLDTKRVISDFGPPKSFR